MNLVEAMAYSGMWALIGIFVTVLLIGLSPDSGPCTSFCGDGNLEEAHYLIGESLTCVCGDSDE